MTPWATGLPPLAPPTPTARSESWSSTPPARSPASTSPKTCSATDPIVRRGVEQRAVAGAEAQADAVDREARREGERAGARPDGRGRRRRCRRASGPPPGSRIHRASDSSAIVMSSVSTSVTGWASDTRRPSDFVAPPSALRPSTRLPSIVTDGLPCGDVEREALEPGEQPGGVEEPGVEPVRVGVGQHDALQDVADRSPCRRARCRARPRSPARRARSRRRGRAPLRAGRRRRRRGRDARRSRRRRRGRGCRPAASARRRGGRRPGRGRSRRGVRPRERGRRARRRTAAA